VLDLSTKELHCGKENEEGKKESQEDQEEVIGDSASRDAANASVECKFGGWTHPAAFFLGASARQNSAFKCLDLEVTIHVRGRESIDLQDRSVSDRFENILKLSRHRSLSKRSRDPKELHGGGRSPSRTSLHRKFPGTRSQGKRPRVFPTWIFLTEEELNVGSRTWVRTPNSANMATNRPIDFGDRTQRSREATMANKPKRLDELFHDTLKDIYFAEKKILATLPKMAKAARSPDLQKAFEKHRGETVGHVTRLEKVFVEIGKKPQAKTCDAIVGITDEGAEIMKEYRGSPALDAGLLAAAQAVEHYEMSRYGTLKAWAQELGLNDAVRLLDKTLEEEKKTDATLTKIAETIVNQQAEAA
jgi:ferritin-like metal-binding protein YciE